MFHWEEVAGSEKSRLFSAVSLHTSPRPPPPPPPQVLHSSAPRVGPGGGCPWRWHTWSRTHSRCFALPPGPSVEDADSSGRTSGPQSLTGRIGPERR